MNNYDEDLYVEGSMDCPNCGEEEAVIYDGKWHCYECRVVGDLPDEDEQEGEDA